MRWRRRSEWPVGDYHLYNRGARRITLFADDGDRTYFTRLVGLTALKYEVDVTSMLLMTNHYHMTARADGRTLGVMLRDLEKTYSRRFNEKTGFTGALFQGRFGSTLLPDLDSLAYVSRYVHANCRDLGVPPHLYRWSTIGAYLGRTEAPDWLETTRILEHVGGPAAYRRYLDAVPPLRKHDSEEDRAQSALVDHIRERVHARIAGRRDLPDGLSENPLTAWVGIRRFALKPKVLAKALGYASGRSVSTLVCRLDRRLEDDMMELRRILESC
jgi:REP element-mobilizing transposase RayT